MEGTAAGSGAGSSMLSTASVLIDARFLPLWTLLWTSASIVTVLDHNIIEYIFQPKTLAFSCLLNP